jgi:hypothetical protein
MTTVKTYQGVVREGRIQLSTAPHLPEGSQVYVIVAGSEPLLDEQTSQRKATRWLVENVGNMLVAAEGQLMEVDGRIVWRFGAFITGRGHKPWGPIGYVDIEAHSGDVLASEQQADELMAHGTTFISSLS